MRHSLLWRIALPYALLIILGIGGIAGYIYLSLRNFEIEQSGEALLSEARLLREDVAPLLTSSTRETQLNALVGNASTVLGVRVTVILVDGTVIAESDRPVVGMENHLARPEVVGALSGRESTNLRFSDTLKEEMLYAAAPVYSGSQVTGVVRVATPFTTVQATINRMVGTIGGVAALTAGLGVILAFWIAGSTLRPLQNLAASAEQISRGILPTVINPRGKDEISQLQVVFNEMYQQLSGRFNELRAERGKLEAVLMNMTDGILIVDPQGAVQLANPAAMRLFDASLETATRVSLVEVVRQHQIVDLWRSCIQTRQQQSATLETITGRMNLQVIATPLGQEMEGAVLLVFQDLTRIRRLETVRRDFISNVSHELRTPLASLKALTETLQEGALDDPPAARRFLAQMETEIDNLTQMVRELLELSRIESGRVPLQLKPCDPCGLVERASERMRLQAERAGLRLDLACPGSVPPVLADEVRIEQVMVNLLHNAIKFTPPGGAITTGLYPRARDVVIYVRDSGVGIAPDDLTRIFERFYKADRSRSGGGTGLGLSIARRLIESHNGQIWAESQVGQGSTFFFSLPLA